MSAMGGKLRTWMQGLMPTRESLEQNRWIRPIAHLVLRDELWRLNRRSVPRGVALGLFTGILIPFMHTPLAVTGAVVVRGNVPVAAATTWTSNPFTWAIMFPTAFRISSNLGVHTDMTAFNALVAHGAGLGQWIAWLLSSAAPAVLLGLFVEATIVASIGYLLAGLVWRWRVVSRRKRKLALARNASVAQAGAATEAQSRPAAGAHARSAAGAPIT